MYPKVTAAIVLVSWIPLVLSAQEPHPAARMPRLTTARIAQLATPATVTIVTLGAGGDTLAQGSGFVVRSDGVIVTNWHVLVGASNAIVVMNNGERYDRVRFVDGDSGVDIALLKVPGYGLPVLPSSSQVPAPGEKVVVLGSPLGLSRTVTDGIVSATRVVAGRQIVQVTAAISPGSSGGPVIDASGRAFAISTFYLAGGQQLNFAVPVRYALGLLSSTIRERALSDVFGGAAPSGAASSAAPSASAPPRARQIRASVQGTYLFTFTWSGQFTVSYDGLIVSAEEPVGLAVEFLKDTLGRVVPNVVFIKDLRTNADGQVVLAYSNLVFDGYQTDDGFFVRAHLPGGVEQTILARRQSIPLSNNTGLYRVHARTVYRSTLLPTDWTGTAAVVAAHDSIFVDMKLHNTLGGTSDEFVAWGALTSAGAFRLVEQVHAQPSVLDGLVRGGRFSADWTYVAGDGVTFTGFMEGARY